MLAAEFVVRGQLARSGREIGQLCVAALRYQPRHGVAAARAARFADHAQERRLKVRQGDGAVARHGLRLHRAGEKRSPALSPPERGAKPRGREEAARTPQIVGERPPGQSAEWGEQGTAERHRNKPRGRGGNSTAGPTRLWGPSKWTRQPIKHDRLLPSNRTGIETAAESRHGRSRSAREGDRIAQNGRRYGRVH